MMTSTLSNRCFVSKAWLDCNHNLFETSSINCLKLTDLGIANLIAHANT